MSFHFAVLSGDGLNCERETANAFQTVGIEACILPTSELFANPRLLWDFDGLALPGGFSYGDELGSGRVLALKLKHFLGDLLEHFRADGRPILGVCNGFQVLTQLGLLPGGPSWRASLVANDSGHFINAWVGLKKQRSHCKWTTFVEDEITLPIRHGEGKLIFSCHPRIFFDQGLIPLTYRENPNGSTAHAAALCDSSGLVFGLMPHPEAAMEVWPSRGDKRIKAEGRQIFQSILAYLEERK